MDIKDIKELILTINNTDIERVEIEKDKVRIMISKGNSNKNKDSIINTPKTIEIKDDREVIQREEISPEEEELYIVKSPMVGVYYESPSPGADSFVKVGSIVGEGQTLCIIEAMKLMNEIESEVSGEIVEILVQNEDVVQYGQALMKIRRV